MYLSPTPICELKIVFGGTYFKCANSFRGSGIRIHSHWTWICSPFIPARLSICTKLKLNLSLQFGIFTHPPNNFHEKIHSSMCSQSFTVADTPPLVYSLSFLHWIDTKTFYISIHTKTYSRIPAFHDVLNVKHARTHTNTLAFIWFYCLSKFHLTLNFN